MHRFNIENNTLKAYTLKKHKTFNLNKIPLKCLGIIMHEQIFKNVNKFSCLEGVYLYIKSIL